MVEPEELMDEETDELQDEESDLEEQPIIVPDIDKDGEQTSQNLQESGNKFHEISDSIAPHSEI